jgi:hypothetical protein
MVAASTAVGAVLANVTSDQVPLIIGMMAGAAVTTYQIIEKVGTLSHDEAKRRLREEVLDHDATRKELSLAKRRILELEGAHGP